LIHYSHTKHPLFILFQEVSAQVDRDIPDTLSRQYITSLLYFILIAMHHKQITA